jgi:hypothetical protein
VHIDFFFFFFFIFVASPFHNSKYSTGTRALRAEHTAPREARRGAGAGLSTQGKSGAAELAQMWRAHGVAGRGGALHALLCADIGPSLRAPLYRAVLADPETARAFAAVSRTGAAPDALDRLLSRNGAAIGRTVDAIVARTSTLALSVLVTSRDGPALLAAAKRALSFVDANIRPVTDADCHIALGVAAALAPGEARYATTRGGAVGTERARNLGAEAAEVLGSLLARPRPRASLLTGARGGSGGAGAGDGKASSRFIKNIGKIIAALDPELVEHLDGVGAADASHCSGAELVSSLLAREIERLFVGWLPMETVLFAWDQWLFCGERPLAAAVAGVVIDLRNDLLRSLGAGAVDEVLHAGAASVGADTLRGYVSAVMASELDALAAQASRLTSGQGLCVFFFLDLNFKFKFYFCINLEF